MRGDDQIGIVSRVPDGTCADVHRIDDLDRVGDPICRGTLD